jgi:CMP-N-acetylneuraminic acid synthetase
VVTSAVEMPPERSHDIDTLADFERCERLLMERSAS